MQDTQKRDEYEIREDYHSVKRALEVFKDKDRLAEIQAMIKNKQESREALEAIGDGNLSKALGL